MAFTYQRAWGRKKGPNQPWAEVNVGSNFIYYLNITYSDLIIEVTNPFFPTARKFDFFANTNLYSDSNLSIIDWLASLGETNIPTEVYDLEYRSGTVLYSDAVQAGFHVRPIRRGDAPDAEVEDSVRTDALVTKSNVNYMDYASKVLFSVNGYYHFHETGTHGFYVYDANTTRRYSGDNSLGVTSLVQVGECTLIPITEEMLYQNVPGGKFVDQFYIELPEDIGERSVMVVLGGRLHILDDFYSVVGDRNIKISPTKETLPDIMYEDRAFLDFKGFPIESPEWSYQGLPLADLFSDDFVKAYATMSQSFIVIVDTPNLAVSKLQIENSRIPGIYTVGEEPVKPIILGSGRLAEYRRTRGELHWRITALRPQQKRHLYGTRDWTNDTLVDEAGLNPNPFFYPNAYLLSITNERLEKVFP